MIKVYDPPTGRPETYYLERDMSFELERFTEIRSEMVNMLRGYPEQYWDLKGRHDGFSPYNSKLLLTHSLNVDYAHLFSIEQLGLTKTEFKDEILTIP